MHGQVAKQRGMLGQVAILRSMLGQVAKHRGMLSQVAKLRNVLNSVITCITRELKPIFLTKICKFNYFCSDHNFNIPTSFNTSSGEENDLYKMTMKLKVHFKSFHHRRPHCSQLTGTRSIKTDRTDKKNKMSDSHSLKKVLKYKLKNMLNISLMAIYKFINENRSCLWFPELHEHADVKFYPLGQGPHALNLDEKYHYMTDMMST